jgi:hypothetical protein
VPLLKSRDDTRRKAQSGVNLPQNVQSIEDNTLVKGKIVPQVFSSWFLKNRDLSMRISRG